MMAMSHDVFKEKNGLSLITYPTLQSMLLVDMLNNYLSVPIYLCDAARNSNCLFDDDAFVYLMQCCLTASRSSERIGLRLYLTRELVGELF